MRPLVVAEFNVLLDPFPDNYEGYLIRTDFRIGVQIALALADDDLADTEKAAMALYLLYGEACLVAWQVSLPYLPKRKEM